MSIQRTLYFLISCSHSDVNNESNINIWSWIIIIYTICAVFMNYEMSKKTAAHLTSKENSWMKSLWMKTFCFPYFHESTSRFIHPFITTTKRKSSQPPRDKQKRIYMKSDAVIALEVNRKTQYTKANKSSRILRLKPRDSTTKSNFLPKHEM